MYDTRIYALIELMRKDLLAHDILHGDETSLNCLDEKDREKSYMWVQGTPENSDQRIILYTYNRDRTSDFARKLYAGFKGYVQVDGYDGYHDIPDVIPVGCFAHARRYVFGALKDSKLYQEYQKTADKQAF